MRWFESSHPSFAMSAPALAAALAAFERGDVESALPRFSKNCVYREPHKEPLVGRDAIAAHWNAFVTTGVRWRFNVDRVIAEGDAACVVYRFAIAKGEGDAWRERAGCAVIRIGARGLIEEWREYDG